MAVAVLFGPYVLLCKLLLLLLLLLVVVVVVVVDINDWMDMTTTQAGRLAEDRILFRQKVQEATSRQEIS